MIARLRTIGVRLTFSWLSGGTPPEKGLDASSIRCRCPASAVRLLAWQWWRAGSHDPEPVRFGGTSDSIARPGPGSDSTAIGGSLFALTQAWRRTCVRRTPYGPLTEADLNCRVKPRRARRVIVPTPPQLSRRACVPRARLPRRDCAGSA